VEARLQKILSAAGVSSRRTAESLIVEGRVTVNGVAVTELGSKADPDRDDIRVDGRRIRTSSARRYILMFKPRGYITSRSDPLRRPTVIDLLTKGGVREYVYPVGRLDYDSEGLLLLTSDGELAERLMHPSHGVAREYHVRVRGVPDEHTLERLSQGILIDGRKTARAEVATVRVVETASGGDAVLSLVIREGRNRQVRRMCEAVGYPVVRLRRVRIGPIHDAHIRPGEFRDLTPQEVTALKAQTANPPRRTSESNQRSQSRPPTAPSRSEPPTSKPHTTTAARPTPRTPEPPRAVPARRRAKRRT
jgi:pseudouridine synthase